MLVQLAANAILAATECFLFNYLKEAVTSGYN